MSAEIKKEIQLEIAHVLFIDIVGYSKFSINEQGAAVDELTKVVRSSDQYQKAEAAGRLIKIPTGDGMGRKKDVSRYESKTLRRSKSTMGKGKTCRAQWGRTTNARAKTNEQSRSLRCLFARIGVCSSSRLLRTQYPRRC
jgi:hypothetical protein